MKISLNLGHSKEPWQHPEHRNLQPTGPTVGREPADLTQGTPGVSEFLWFSEGQWHVEASSRLGRALCARAVGGAKMMGSSRQSNLA